MALVDGDPLVEDVLAQVELEVQESIFGRFTERAQRFLAAAMLAQVFQEPEGRGALSSETVGGVTQSWTMPNLNMKTQIGATQYGLRFIEIRNMVIPPAAMVPPR